MTDASQNQYENWEEFTTCATVLFKELKTFGIRFDIYEDSGPLVGYADTANDCAFDPIGPFTKPFEGVPTLKNFYAFPKVYVQKKHIETRKRGEVEDSLKDHIAVMVHELLYLSQIIFPTELFDD